MINIFWMIALSFCLLLSPDIISAQTAKEAYLSLKKIEASTQTGISYKDYSTLLSEAKFKINIFKESDEAKENIKINQLIDIIFNRYELSLTFWNFKIKGGGGTYTTSSDHPINLAFLKEYPEANRNIEEGGSIYEYTSTLPDSKTKVQYRLLDIDTAIQFPWKRASLDLTNLQQLKDKSTKERSINKNELKEENEKLKAENALLTNELEELKNKMPKQKKK